MKPLLQLGILLSLAVSDLYAETVVLCHESKEALPVVFSDESLSESATVLAGMLEKISGAAFPVTESEVQGPAIRLSLSGNPSTIPAMQREDYSIQTSKSGGLSLTGSTPLAVRHAVWDVLHHIGYRQFFPGETWEVIPRKPTIALDENRKESPDYASRRIWYGHGFWDHNREAWNDWVRKNRMEGGFSLNTGHAYHRLIRSQQAAFDAHPEYYALVDGERTIHDHAKLCVSNPGLRDAASAYGIDYFRENPEADSVSMDPSDGGYWCECAECLSMGPPSDRATFLANTVAEAVVAEFGPDKRVGMYAYNQHSPPPSIRVHPNAVISAATGFIKGGLTIDEIIAGWQRQGAMIGIREYYSVNTWDRDLPGAARGSNLAYLSTTIPDFHGKGARFLSAESSDNWGCNGLGYYFASRALWDLETTGEDRKTALVEDFLTKAFGPARNPMAEFYEKIDGKNRPQQLVFEDLLARLFRLLKEARTLAADDPPVLRRIDDLILYTRFASLYDDYRTAAGPPRQQRFEAMLRYSYRIRNTFMVHTLAHWRDIEKRDPKVSFPEGTGSTPFWRISEKRNPWKSGTPFSQDEISAFLEEGIHRYEPVELDFAPRDYPDSPLVPALTLHPDLSLSNATEPNPAARGERTYYAAIGDEAPVAIDLAVTGGLIPHYRDRGHVKISLWKIGGESATGEKETLITEDASVPPDGEEHTVTLRFPSAGTYRIEVDDGNDATGVSWPEGSPISWKMSADEHPGQIKGRWTFYFYVPTGTTRVGLYTEAGMGRGSQLRTPDGSVALELENKQAAYRSAPVPPGMDGQLWQLHRIGGGVRLLNVPPYLARSAKELILPAIP